LCVQEKETSAPSAPIQIFRVHQETGVDTTSDVRELFVRAGYPNVLVTSDTVYRVQGNFNPNDILPLLYNPQAGQSVVDFLNRPDNSGVVEIAYRPSVTDPETESGLAASRLMGVVGVEWIRKSQLYTIQGLGVDDKIAEKVLTSSRLYFNPVVHVVVKGDTYKHQLRPTGRPLPLEHFDFRGEPIEELLELSKRKRWNLKTTQILKLQQYQQEVLQRPYTGDEVEMVAQWWCDHCLHTTWLGLGIFQAMKKAIEELGDPDYVSVLEGNAGAFLFYEDLVLTIKGESHNHPSGVFTLGGIETKHGGLFRDPMAMFKGGKVLGGTTYIGTQYPGVTQPVSGALHPKVIVAQAIAGTSNYCNPSGIPNMDARYRQDVGYVKPWCVGVAIGIQPLDSIENEEPLKGDHLFLIGGPTGRDGIHGATGSSAELSAAVVALEAAEVQIGQPICQRGPTMLIPAVRDKGLARKWWDLGAGGISCALGEAAKYCGADACYDGMSLKDESLASWEKGLSESQERFLVDVPEENIPAFLEECAVWEVVAFDLAICRDDRRLVIHDSGKVVADWDLGFVWDEVPIDELTIEEPEEQSRRVAVSPNSVTFIRYPSEILNEGDFMAIVGGYDMSDQSEASVRYDKTVQGHTYIEPLLAGDVPSDVAVYAPVFGKRYGAVYAGSFVPRWSRTDPVGSIRNLMSLTFSRAFAVGVKPWEMMLCDNFYNATRTPQQRWYLRAQGFEMLRFGGKTREPGSGKDSSWGTYVDEEGNFHDVPPTFVPSVVGKMPDVLMAKTKVFARPGDMIYLIRPDCQPNMAGSVALDFLDGDIDLRPDAMALPWVEDEDELIRLWHLIHEHHSVFSSLAAIGEGGAFMQAFFGCLASGLGAKLCLTDSYKANWDLFGECPGGFLVTSDNDLPSELEGFGKQIGEVVSEPGLQIMINGLRTSPNLAQENWDDLVSAWKGGFREVVYR